MVFLNGEKTREVGSEGLTVVDQEHNSFFFYAFANIENDTKNLPF